jgi:hypothetical protein
MTLNHILYTIYRNINTAPPVGMEAIRSGISFSEAQRNLIRSYEIATIDALVNVTNCLAHGFHFYLYMAFSVRFRAGVLNKFSKKKCRQ